MSLEPAPASHAMVRALVEGGVTHVYGIPGGYTIKVFEAIRDAEGIDAVLAPSEQIAACMADMHGRITRRAAVLSGQGAFIAGTGSFGIMEAYLSGTPMVIVTEMTDHGIAQHNATQSITGDFASVDLPAILRAMTKFTTVATTPNEAVHGIQLALHHAMSGRPGPAAVIGRLDGFYGTADPSRHPRYGHTVRVHERAPARPTAGVIAAVASGLRDAKLPVIVAGNGTHGCYDQLEALAGRAAAPVVTTQKARGAIADNHPWAGGMLGAFGSPTAYGLLRQADVVLVLGSRLNPADTMMESPEVFSVDRQTIVQVDCVAEHLGRAIPVSSGIVSDVGDFLDALLPEIGVDEATVDSRWDRLEALRASIDDEVTLTGSSSPLRPQRVVGVLNDLLTDRHRIVLDAGNNRIFHYRYLRMPVPGRVHMCGGHLGMGWGPSAALAAAMLRPDDRVLSIVGDGGMQMALPALAFAAAHQLPLTFIVMNNGVLGNVLDAQKSGRYAVDLPPIDYTAVAQAFGLSARRVDTDSTFDDAVRVADRLGGPALIEVMTDAGESSGQLRVRG
ncbi:MAG TPA: thiamine pyrophosphate-binding protein [Acidimicrobiales bacterium]|nr:thiamine pyrophosphate-binding protein [Acidimicrobiales bacterium]